MARPGDEFFEHNRRQGNRLRLNGSIDGQVHELIVPWLQEGVEPPQERDPPEAEEHPEAAQEESYDPRPGIHPCENPVFELYGPTVFHFILPGGLFFTAGYFPCTQGSESVIK